MDTSTIVVDMQEYMYLKDRYEKQKEHARRCALAYYHRKKAEKDDKFIEDHKERQRKMYNSNPEVRERKKQQARERYYRLKTQRTEQQA